MDYFCQAPLVGPAPMVIAVNSAMVHGLKRFCGSERHAPQAPPPSPYPDGSGALPPTPKPATERCLGRWPPWGATLHPGQSRAPGQPGATRPGQGAISTQRHPQSHPASRGRRDSRPPLCLAARPRPGRRLGAPDANSGQARCDRRRAGRSDLPGRRAPRVATVPVSLAGVRGLDGAPERAQAGMAQRPPPSRAPPPDGGSDPVPPAPRAAPWRHERGPPSNTLRPSAARVVPVCRRARLTVMPLRGPHNVAAVSDGTAGARSTAAGCPSRCLRPARPPRTSSSG
jgi:hypothetical protein